MSNRNVPSPVDSIIYSSDFVNPSRPSSSRMGNSTAVRNLNRRTNDVTSLNTPVHSQIQQSSSLPRTTHMQPDALGITHDPTGPSITPYNFNWNNGHYHDVHVSNGTSFGNQNFPNIPDYRHLHMPENVQIHDDLMHVPVYSNNQQIYGMSSPFQWSYHYNQPPVWPNLHHVPPGNGYGQNMTINTPTGRIEMNQNAFGQTMNITHF